ncbi:MAG: 4-(cytidine 5'-diphospho)-2-C-methyl-D-erythritol kinase [Demequina sp.]
MRAHVRTRAPAKVNLHLSVGPVADNGYHPLVTVFQAVNLYDTVVVRPRTDGQFTLEIETAPTITVGPEAIPRDDTNLAMRAARLVAEHAGIDDGVDIQLLKRIPVAGGMAGGSADAAAALVACAELWEVGATRSTLHDLAAQLGADVPFALHGATALGLGRGDELSPVMTHGEFHWVFATQSEGLSTPAVYGQFDSDVATGERLAVDPAPNEKVMKALMAGDAHALGEALSNDLQDSALTLAPHLRATMDTAREAEALGVIVSGSGPTVAALARSRQHALAIAAHLTASDTADAVLTASGPATGAVVVGS